MAPDIVRTIGRKACYFSDNTNIDIKGADGNMINSMFEKSYRGGNIQVSNKIWWLCLVPTSTTRFASDVGYRMAKSEEGYIRKCFFFMNNYI